MKKRFGVIASIVAAASFFSLITASVAWFEARTDVDFGTGHGSTAASYFESGAGTSDSPYVISNSTHMYNLAWLQYLGQFNTTVSPTYFKLKNDIDMSALGSALPPIGTQSNPFIGIFDGQSHTISNLTVSNNLNDIAKHPSTVQALSGVSVVGFFGIVGNPQPIGIARGDTHLDYTELQVFDKLNLHHFNLQNVVVKSTTSQTLMGIVAGYVNGHDGTVHDIGVLNGSLQAAQGATCLQHFADDDADDPARPISKFSLIGETEDTEWKEAYDDSGTGSGDGPGDDASFGGSMNMWDTNRRISCILKQDIDTSTSTGSYYRTKNSGTNTYGAYMQVQGGTTPFCVTSSGPIKDVNTLATNASYATLRSGAVAINTDVSTMLSGTETVAITTISSTKWPTVTTPYYGSHTSETILSSNTGYFTGDKPYGTSTTNGSVVFGSKKKSLITNSYNGSELKLMSNLPTSSGFTTIKDDSQSSSTSAQSPDYFGYTNYSRVREGLLPVLQNANTSGFINGFRLSAESSGAPVSQAFNLTNASINGTTYSSYAVLPRGLNFMCSNKGAITLVTTGYDSTVTTAKSMFRLYSVTRNANKTSISSATEITKVYRDTSGNITYNSGPSGSTLCFDSSKWANTLGSGYLYYCEIPVNAGEFFIGGPASGNSGYLVYLDIGANGNGSGGGGTTPTGDYDLKNVRYVHQIVNNGSTDSSDDYIDILFKISTAGANGTVALYFSRHDATMLYYHQNGTATNVDVTVFIAKETNIQDTTSAVWST